MTSGAFMGIVGAYLMSFAQHRGVPDMEWIGAALATVGFIVAWHYEEKYKDHIDELEKIVYKKRTQKIIETNKKKAEENSC